MVDVPSWDTLNIDRDSTELRSRRQTRSTVERPAGATLVVPFDMAARRGAGLGLGPVLGGGGAFFVAMADHRPPRGRPRGADCRCRPGGRGIGRPDRRDRCPTEPLPRLWTELRGLARRRRLVGGRRPVSLQPSQDGRSSVPDAMDADETIQETAGSRAARTPGEP